ncbi:hypothetical protein BS78_01G442100 [Paspalum vaginatum]|nr:hypothetical protein BS78_01G442100 [Paspalum vaginatum]
MARRRRWLAGAVAIRAAPPRSCCSILARPLPFLDLARRSGGPVRRARARGGVGNNRHSPSRRWRPCPLPRPQAGSAGPVLFLRPCGAGSSRCRESGAVAKQPSRRQFSSHMGEVVLTAVPCRGRPCFSPVAASVHRDGCAAVSSSLIVPSSSSRVGPCFSSQASYSPVLEFFARTIWLVTLSKTGGTFVSAGSSKRASKKTYKNVFVI